MLRLFTLVIVATAFICAIESDSLKPNTRDSIGKTCKPVNCKGKIKHCPYGYKKQHGCEICKCYDPCNPPGKAMLCGADERCFIDKTAYGTFITRCDSIRSKRNKEACEQEQVVGLCKAAFPRFYYNLTMEKCEPFIFGGCGGNDNNFKTKDECETTCMA